MLLRALRTVGTRARPAATIQRRQHLHSLSRTHISNPLTTAPLTPAPLPAHSPLGGAFLRAPSRRAFSASTSSSSSLQPAFQPSIEITASYVSPRLDVFRLVNNEFPNHPRVVKGDIAVVQLGDSPYRDADEDRGAAADLASYHYFYAQDQGDGAAGGETQSAHADWPVGSLRDHTQGLYAMPRQLDPQSEDPPLPTALGRSRLDVAGMYAAGAGDASGDESDEEQKQPAEGYDLHSRSQKELWKQSEASRRAPIGPFSPAKRYAVFFPYGSVVFFNATSDLERDCLDKARMYGMSPFLIPATDDYKAVVSSELEDDNWAQFEPDCVSIRKLDLNSIRVISEVMAQTVAMEQYEKSVDAMLHQFRVLNGEMERSGEMQMVKNKLFVMVAQNNTILTDLMTQLRLLERSDTAWSHGRYFDLWQGLRDDFELKDRFHALEFKLQHVQSNTKFFLEVAHHQKSDKLEWIIIILISVEIALCMYEIAQASGAT